MKVHFTKNGKTTICRCRGRTTNDLSDDWDLVDCHWCLVIKKRMFPGITRTEVNFEVNEHSQRS